MTHKARVGRPVGLARSLKRVGRARKAQLRAGAELEAADILDAMPYATAVLSRDGTIIAVNRAWPTFGFLRDGTPEDTGVGVNYFVACGRAAAAGCSHAGVIETELTAVFGGVAVEREVEYASSLPEANRWSLLRMAKIGRAKGHVMVSHIDISERKIAELLLERKASEDPLTRLSNCVDFAQRMTSALTLGPAQVPGADVGLMYIDLNGFKQINDRYGHAAGDEILQSVARRLREVTRPQDTVARLGGDEFAVLAPRISADGLATLGERVEQALREPHVVSGIGVRVGGSVGMYLATRGESAVDALRRADDAMYADKCKHDPAVARLRDTA